MKKLSMVDDIVAHIESQFPISAEKAAEIAAANEEMNKKMMEASKKYTIRLVRKKKRKQI